VLVAIRQLLGASAPPKAVTDLEAKRSATDRLRIRLAASKWWWGFLAALSAVVMALVFVWVLVTVRDARALRTSFYNVELEYLRSSDRPPTDKDLA